MPDASVQSDSSTPRLPAAERRAGIVGAATGCFAARGFGGTTTASVAAAAGVNEALLFRHFGSKQGLYLACVDAAWQHLRERVELLCEHEPDERHWRMPGRAFLELVRDQPEIVQLWTRALVDTTGIVQVDDHVAELMREVHAYVAKQVRHSDRAGGVLPDRDPGTEAWTIIALGLLGATLGTRHLIEQGDFDAVLAAHREWMTASAT
jgi:AcrR family transcriptional regulator